MSYFSKDLQRKLKGYLKKMKGPQSPTKLGTPTNQTEDRDNVSVVSTEDDSAGNSFTSPSASLSTMSASSQMLASDTGTGEGGKLFQANIDLSKYLKATKLPDGTEEPVSAAEFFDTEGISAVLTVCRKSPSFSPPFFEV